MTARDAATAPGGAGHGEEMSLALELIQEFNSPAGAPDLVQKVLARAVAETQSDRGALSWLEGEDMIVAASRDPLDELLGVGSRWPLTADEVTRVALAAGRATSGRFQTPDLEMLSPGLRAAYAKLQHMLVTPIVASGEPLAVLVVSRRRDEAYADGHRRALDVVAAAAAQPLRSARLEDMLTQARREPGGRDSSHASVEHTKTDVIRLASHELRGPLAVLHGYLALIRAGHFGEITPALGEVLAILDRRTEHMKSLVNDMLVAARVDEQPDTATAELVDLRAVVREAVTSVAARVTPAHPLVTRVPRQRVPATADTEKLSLAIRNVLDNAVKYSPQGGEVVCALDIDGDGEMATIRVSDAGLGIAPEDRNTLFTRFGRVVTKDNSHIAGIGLGLYYAREVMRRHGGDIVLVDSGPQGSTFELTLPLARKERASTP